MRSICFALSAIFLAGCVSSAPRFEGQSVLVGEEKRNLFLELKRRFAVDTGCNTTDSVKVEVIKRTKGPSSALRTASEVWTIQGCNLAVPYRLFYFKTKEGVRSAKISRLQ